MQPYLFYNGKVNLVLSYENDKRITLPKHPENFSKLEQVVQEVTMVKDKQIELKYIPLNGNNQKQEIMGDGTLKQAYEQYQESIDIYVEYDNSIPFVEQFQKFELPSQSNQVANSQRSDQNQQIWITLGIDQQQQTIAIPSSFQELKQRVKEMKMNLDEATIALEVKKIDNSMEVIDSDQRYLQMLQQNVNYSQNSIIYARVITKQKLIQSQHEQKLQKRDSNTKKPQHVIQMEEMFQKQMMQITNVVDQMSNKIQKLEEAQKVLQQNMQKEISNSLLSNLFIENLSNNIFQHLQNQDFNIQGQQNFIQRQFQENQPVSMIPQANQRQIESQRQNVVNLQLQQQQNLLNQVPEPFPEGIIKNIDQKQGNLLPGNIISFKFNIKNVSQQQ